MKNINLNKIVITLIFAVILFGSNIIINTISADPDCFNLPFQQIGDVDIREANRCHDFENLHGWIYLLGYLQDEDDNDIGYVNITGGMRLEQDGRIYVYGSASAGTIGNVEGSGDAWGQLPGRGEVTDANPMGNVELGPWESANAWDSYYTDEIPEENARAGATLTVNGVTIGISVDVPIL